MCSCFCATESNLNSAKITEKSWLNRISWFHAVPLCYLSKTLARLSRLASTLDSYSLLILTSLYLLMTMLHGLDVYFRVSGADIAVLVDLRGVQREWGGLNSFILSIKLKSYTFHGLIVEGKERVTPLNLTRYKYHFLKCPRRKG